MALIDLLTNSLDNYDDLDPDWKNFILDHKQYLIDKSTMAIISTSYMQGYRYSLRRYLRSISYNIHCAWIVGLVNNLPTDVMFTDTVNSLRLPPFSVIESLYTTYLTLKTNSS